MLPPPTGILVMAGALDWQGVQCERVIVLDGIRHRLGPESRPTALFKRARSLAVPDSEPRSSTWLRHMKVESEGGVWA